MADEQSDGNEDSGNSPDPLNATQRRILGVLIEKARTTPDAYPLSLNGLLTGCNQKSNRAPVMNLTAEHLEDELVELRNRGIVAEVHGGGRVPKYRHYGYDYLGVRGVEAGVMTELLLRGEQSLGDLRSRASRFEAITDVNALQSIISSLVDRKLVVALTPSGRGQMVTHNLYEPDELSAIREAVATGVASTTTSSQNTSGPNNALRADVEDLKRQVAALGETIQKLADRLDRLES